jgi:hypothetical protein
MPPRAAPTDRDGGTFLPYWPDAIFATLLPVANQLTGALMFIFQRPFVAPLAALAIAALLVALDSLTDLHTLF